MTELSDKPAPAVQAARPAAAPQPVAAATVAAVSPPVVPPVMPPPHVQVRPEPRRPGRFRRFVRSVFSHLMFAAIVTAGVFGYVYQDMILGRVATTVCGNDALGPYTPGGSKAASATPAAKAAAPMVAAVPPPPAATPAPAPAPAAVATAPIQTPAPKTEAAPAAPAPAQGTSASQAAPQITPQIAAQPKAIEAKPASPAGPSPAAEAPKAAATPKAAASVPVAGIVPPADKPQAAAPAAPAAAPPKPAAPSAAAPSPQDALTSAWRAAREAFNAGKPDAIDAYKSLLRTYPDVPDLAGELGNIYYAAGKWREAGETYYEAAQRYLKSPQPGYAACLLDVLRNLRSPEAERLAPQITRPCPAARSGQAGQTGETASTAPRG